MSKKLSLLLMLISALVVSTPSNADAFCGFYVGGGGAELFNDATQIMLMRDGNKTILSMQNRYEGPLEDFAMVIPVPTVLQESNVKTLDPELFQKADRLSAPRLVEYFEEDPCQEPQSEENTRGGNMDASIQDTSPPSVVVEAQFVVGEYEIVVLSAEDSTGLETWLSGNNYNLPEGAASYYEPYIDQGMFFFVARVDPTKVTYQDGRAVLSPLRFDYESDTFNLPIRLGMLNSSGEQDLIINILARNQRYDVANYENVTIPTNLEVTADTVNNFGDFYRTLFAKTLLYNPGAVVTEYSWAASSCDPCPSPVMDSEDLLTLGADVIGNEAELDFSWVLTRLHARYAKGEISEDLIFRQAPPIAGGREFVIDKEGTLEIGAISSSVNNFQGRYIIRHPWQGALDCKEPYFGIWGSGSAEPATGPNSGGGDLNPSTTVVLEQQLVSNADEIGVTGEGTREVGAGPSGNDATDSAGPSGNDGSCSGCAVSAGGGEGSKSPFAIFTLLVGFAWFWRRRQG